MGTEKQERHANDHDQRPRREEPASTDMADIIKEEQAAKAASAHQRKSHPAEKKDIHGRILRVQVLDGETEILIGGGQEQGIHVNQHGYIKAGEGMLAEFTVNWSNENTATARVNVSPQAIYETGDVVINPSSLPAAAENREGRVIGVQITGDYVEITIGAGGAHGVRHGMKGFLHSDESKDSYADFTIHEVRATVSRAYVKLPNLDVLHAHSKVTINPTSGTKAKAPDKHHHHG
jgi:hypothetical protein